MAAKRRVLKADDVINITSAPSHPGTDGIIAHLTTQKTNRKNCIQRELHKYRQCCFQHGNNSSPVQKETMKWKMDFQAFKAEEAEEVLFAFFEEKQRPE